MSGAFNHKVDGTYQAGRQRWAAQLPSEHAGTPLWLWLNAEMGVKSCLGQTLLISPVRAGSWEDADFLRKCKLGNITTEETEKRTTQLPLGEKTENNEILR